MVKSINAKRIAVLLCCTVCSLIMGFCYTYSIIQPFVMEHFSIDSSTASFPYTIFLAVFVAGNYIGGVMQKKFNVKIVLLIGYFLMIIGIFTTSLLPSNIPAAMWITYGGFIGIGDGMVYNVILAIVQKWFPDRKGLVTGVALAALGLSATILSPLCSGWLKSYGFDGMFRIVSAIFVVVAIFGIMTIKSPPDGYMADFKPSGAVAASTRQCVTAKDCFTTKEYYMLTLILFCAVPAYILLSAIFVSYGGTRGVDSELAVTGVSIASLIQVGGRLIVPAFSDKFGRKKALVLCFAITIIAVILLNFSSGILYVLCFWLLSFTYGGSSATTPPMITDYLGSKNAGFVVSLAMIGSGIASLGTSLASKIVSIPTAFIIAGITAVIGIITTLLLPKPESVGLLR